MSRLQNFHSFPLRFLVVSMLVVGFQTVSQPAASANPVECQQNLCRERFEFSGAELFWAVPDSIADLSIRVAGASGGGDRGGSAALISADLKLAAGTELSFRIGGQGKQGNGALGGYNGGGSAGTGSTKAGSGGGATHVTNVSSGKLLLVAGGGGGAGSGSEAAGGSGGLSGSPGGSIAESTGGGGGGSAAGGVAGKSQRVTNGAGSGGLVVGGNGASPLFGAPGGGGGGGYFGGGGGGSQTNICCFPSSGGGGGSSFVSESGVSNVVFTQARIGSGYIEISYRVIPSITDGIWTQKSPTSAVLNLEFNIPITDLEPSDFDVSGCATVVSTPSKNAESANWLLEVSNCDRTNVTVELRAMSVASETVFGPVKQTEMSFSLDMVGPRLSWIAPALSLDSSFTLSLTSSESLKSLTIGDLSATGCQVKNLKKTATGADIYLANCNDGPVSISLRANSVTDSVGNPGPAQDLSRRLRVDLQPPKAEFVLRKLEQSIGVAEIELVFSEPVILSLNELTRRIENDNCEVSWVTVSQSRYFAKINCEGSLLDLRLDAETVTDFAGRRGPESAVELSLRFDEDAGEVPSGQFIPPWAVADESTILETDLPDDSGSVAASPQSSPNDSAQADFWQSLTLGLPSWLVPAAASIFALLIALSTLRGSRRRRSLAESGSGKDNGAITIEQYPVFRKPANRLR